MSNHRKLAVLLMVLCVAASLAAVASLAADPPAMLSSEGVTEHFPKALQAVRLVEANEFAAAKDMLLRLTQKDFARKFRLEMMSEDRVEVVPVPAIGNRDLLLARCHLELGEHQPAQALLWSLIEKECTEQDLFILFVREFEEKNFTLAEKKLKQIQRDFPHNDAAFLAGKYLTVAHALPDGEITAAVDLIGSGAWSRDSQRGPSAEFREWTCAQLARYPQATLPVLIDALESNEQPTWIIYCLGQCGSKRAIAPLEKARERIKNYYARLEIDAAMAEIKKANEAHGEPESGRRRK